MEASLKVTFTDPGGLVRYGRPCRACGGEIDRPLYVRQSGMNNAVVCDACWAGVLWWWKRGEMSLREAARTLGVTVPAVKARIAYAGLGKAGVKLARRRSAALAYRRKKGVRVGPISES